MPSDMSLLKLSSDYALHKLEGSILAFHLFNINSGEIYKLNAVSFAFLEAFDGKRTVMDILESAIAHYNIDPQILTDDFMALVGQWKSLHILVGVNPESSSERSIDNGFIK